MNFKETVLSIAQRSYGENAMYVKSRETMLALYWPELTITNRRQVSHLIKEMWMFLPLNDGGTNFSSSLMGMRTRLTLPERRSNYSHSHLSGHGLRNFCTGGDAINEVWGRLKLDAQDYKGDNYKMILEGFFHLVDSFIRYESLEGVPYQRISSIGLRTNSNTNHARVRRSISRIASDLDAKTIRLAIDFNSLSVELVETDALHDGLAALSQEHAYRLPSGRYIDLVNNHVQSEEEDITESTGTARVTIDSGPRADEELRIKVSPYGREEEIINKRKFAHPNIFNRFKTHIENAAKESIIRAAKEQYQAGDQAKRARNNASVKLFNAADIGISDIKTFEGMVGKIVLDSKGKVRSKEAQLS